jgi:hypothetical protein
MKIDAKHIVIAIILAWFLMIFVAHVSGCTTTRTVAKSTIDSVQVTKAESAVKSKVDSGTVTKNESKAEQKDTWFKETITLQPIKFDTTINNYFTKTYIKEGGTTYKNNTTTIFDSTWKHSFDSLLKKFSDSTSLQLKTTDKKSKTVVIPLWQVFGLCALAFLLLWLLQNLSIKSTLKKFKL